MCTTCARWTAGGRLVNGSGRDGRVARELTRLLLTGRYRQEWLRYVSRDRPGEVHVVAVSKYLADRSPYGHVGYLSLRDRVRRALLGAVISPETMRLFIEGFAFSATESATLWRLFDPPTFSGRVIKGSLPARSIGVQGDLRTVSLIDEHFIGPDRLPVKHLTTQVVRAIVPDLQRVGVYADTSEIDFTVLRGGVADTIQSDIDGFPARVYVRLDQPLAADREALLKYAFDFSYTSPPPPIFSRVALQPIENITLAVSFSPARLPTSVWWRIWRDTEHSVVLHEEPVHLGCRGHIFRHLSSLEDAVAGFEWQW
jgi:hypothetical protein